MTGGFVGSIGDLSRALNRCLTCSTRRASVVAACREGQSWWPDGVPWLAEKFMLSVKQPLGMFEEGKAWEGCSINTDSRDL